MIVLVPAAKETGSEEMLNNKDNNNGKRNRFIVTPWRKFLCNRITLPRCIFESNSFMEGVKCKLPFSGKADMGKGKTKRDDVL